MTAELILGALLVFMALVVRPRGVAAGVVWMLSLVVIAALLVVLEVFK